MKNKLCKGEDIYENEKSFNHWFVGSYDEPQIGDGDEGDGEANLFSDGEETAAQTGDDAETIIDSGEVNQSITWTLYDNGELVIDGTGDMADYVDYRLPPWYTYRKNIVSITFEKNITSVGDYACYSLYKLSSVNMKGR